MMAIENRLGLVLSGEDLLTCNTIGELDGVIKNQGASVNVLASALTDAMTGSRSDLMIFDRGSDRWLGYPWPEVYSRAATVAARVSNDHNSAGRAVGVVGEADVNVVSAMMGGLLAGTGVSILPGVVRGADPGRWAEATLRRFTDIGVGAVFSGGAELDVLRASESPGTVIDAATAGQGGDAETATFWMPVLLPSCKGRRVRRASRGRRC